MKNDIETPLLGASERSERRRRMAHAVSTLFNVVSLMEVVANVLILTFAERNAARTGLAALLTGQGLLFLVFNLKTDAVRRALEGKGLRGTARPRRGTLNDSFLDPEGEDTKRIEI